MSEATVADHLLAFIIVVVVPVYAATFAMRRIKRHLADDRPGVRARIYWLNVALQWLVSGVACLIWWQADRSWTDLGFAASWGWGFWVALSTALVVMALLTLQYWVVLRSPRHRRKLREQLHRSAPFMPRNRREMEHFTALAFSAGTCEEIVYRGFLIWYLTLLTGTTLLGLSGAVIVAALVFGACHLYQGAGSAIQVTMLALLAGILFVLGGSLWIVMLLHVYVDISGGLLAVALHRGNQEAVESDSLS